MITTTYTVTVTDSEEKTATDSVMVIVNITEQTPTPQPTPTATPEPTPMPTPEPTPTTTPEPIEVPIVDIDDETPGGGIDEEIILDDNIPEGSADLPKIGEIPSILFYGLGGALALLGVKIRCNKKQ